MRTLLVFMILGAGLPYFSHATIYTVNSTADAGTGAAGTGDLRYCMNQAFADATVGPHTIQFAIGTGAQTITLASDLPSINGENGIIIDATTQPGYVNKPLITISRAGGGNGFTIQNTSLNITIKGFVITGFQRGFMIDNACRFITILNNYINLNQAGTALVTPAAGGSGIFIQNSTDITIGAKGKNNRNIIVGAGNHGIEAVGTSARVTIKNNFIGAYENGASALVLGAANHGIFLNGTDDCVIDSNVIANNTQDGILVDAGALNCLIRYNKIGTDSTGLVPAGNRKEGILVQNSTGAVIQYNVISANLVNGILIEGPSNNSIIQGNKIGVNINGGGANMGNKGSGIYIKISSGHTIGGSRLSGLGNIISNNGTSTATPPVIPTCGSIIGNGIVMDGTTNSTVRGNYIGVDGTGNVASGNDNSGMLVQAGAANITIGGTNPGEGNVVGDNGFACTGAGDRRHGIQVYGAATSNVIIIGNHIGLGVDGTTALGNSQDGISILQTSGHTIGGNTPAHRNVISNNRVGVFIQQGTSINNLVIGNYIGTDATGMLARPNQVGVQIGNGVGSDVTPNFIGRAIAGEGNLISGNSVAGIRLNGNGTDATGTGTGGSGGSNNTRIFNNQIGLNSSGGPLANEYGIIIHEEAKNNFIGGSLALQPNIIANNRNNGLLINNTASNKNWISRNSFYCNETSSVGTAIDKGINLNSIGNNNYGGVAGQLLVYTIGLGSTTTTLNGKAPANSIVEIFSVETCLTCPPAGGVKVEGKTYQATVTANASGDWSWSPVGGLGGQYTITATEPAGTNRNTSEFAPCAFITLPVELMSFKGELVGTDVYLTWITASEKNNAFFNIQRSSDGTTFETIGRIEGHNNSSESLTYTYQDVNSESGILYYRLMQVDRDGTSSFSRVIKVNKGGKNDVNVYPNPVDKVLHIDLILASKSEYYLTVSNIIGETLLSESGISAQGFDQKLIDLSSLPSGIYFLTLQSEGEVWVEKFIKK